MQSWSGMAEAYRQSFARLCGGTVDRLLADTCGADHLDVGCGAGELAAKAAEMGRTVIATDPDSDMIAITATLHPFVLQASLPRLPFKDGQFDSVTANFVVNHVANPRAAMSELARVLRPGGRLAATIWPAQPTAWGTLVQEAFAAAGVVAIQGQRLSADMDFERSVRGLRHLAEGAGLLPVLATDLQWEWLTSVDDLWRGIAGGVATAGQTFLAQTPDVQASAEHEFRERAAAVASDGRLRLPHSAAYVVATR
jgi:ubiquinone/menaquinone biosynthesis C-methylase UbiE